MGIETKAKRAVKFSEEIRKSLYNWIIHHPQVVQSPVVNNSLNVKIDGYIEPQLFVTLAIFFNARGLFPYSISWPLDLAAPTQR